jgi:hypothetical protein
MLRVDSPFIDVASSVFSMKGPILHFDYAGSVTESSSRSVHSPPNQESRTLGGNGERHSGGSSASPGSSAPRSKTRRRLNAALEDTFVRLDRFSCMPFPNGSARSVVCVDTLPFVDSAKNAMLEFHRILTPDGFLLLQLRAEYRSESPALWDPSPPGLAKLLTPFPCVAIAWLGEWENPDVLFAVACREESRPKFEQSVSRFISSLESVKESLAETVLNIAPGSPAPELACAIQMTTPDPTAFLEEFNRE